MTVKLNEMNENLFLDARPPAAYLLVSASISFYKQLQLLKIFACLNKTSHAKKTQMTIHQLG